MLWLFLFLLEGIAIALGQWAIVGVLGASIAILAILTAVS